ncbi:MAG: glycosyltransferase [Magnetococcales bacterium]|nr:glycosyltransferase [Magnetococcales bacterium]
MGKILFIVADLCGGGAERCLIRLCNALVAQQYTISIVAFHNVISYLGALDSRVKLVTVLSDGKPVGIRIGNVLRAILKEARHHDLVIGGRDGWPTVMALVGGWLSGKPVLAWSHSDLGMIRRMWNPALQFLFRWTLRQVDGLVCVSEGVKRSLDRFCGKTFLNAITIYNSIEKNANIPVQHKTYPNGDVINIVGCGRLEYYKGFDLLISALALLRAEGLPVRLTLLGEGPDREAFTALIAANSLQDVVSMPGFCPAPTTYYSQADLLVHPSRFEGFPMVLLEALQHGLPVVATDCPSGPRELLQDGYCGELVEVENVEALVAGIKKVLFEPGLWEMYQQRGLRRITDFSLENIIPQWIKFIQNYLRK